MAFVSLIALFLFAGAAKTYLPVILEPLFALTGGDGSVLGLLFCLFLVVFMAGTWIWSARRPRHD